MRTVFLDTVGLIALWDVNDQWHSAAEEALAQMGGNVITVSTSFVMLECGNAASRRTYRAVVDATRRKLESGNKIIFPDRADWHEAWSDYARAGAGGASIVDYISFVIMRRLNITDAFTNDRHFKAAGFNTLF